uniref:Uncharacterized protein n=1 Tax=Trichinella nativa TaxID=6335 RepID=A0A0V1KIF7_9BILA
MRHTQSLGVLFMRSLEQVINRKIDFNSLEGRYLPSSSAV